MNSLQNIHCFRAPACAAAIFLALAGGYSVARSPASAGTNSGPSGQSESDYQNTLRNLPLAFEPNVGQADPSAKFLARGNRFRVAFTQGGPLLAFMGEGASHYSLLRMALADSNPDSKIAGEEPVASTTNYINSSSKAGSHMGVANYAKVAYHDVYPGIDLVYHSNGAKLEYDFVVAPGSDPTAIKVKFPGAQNLRIDALSGDLVVTAADGQTVRNGRPAIYQQIGTERSAVQGGYRMLNAQTVAFEIDKYDASRALVIDPTVYTFNIEGNNVDLATAITSDSAGNAYVVGLTDSTKGFPFGGNINAIDVLPPKTGNITGFGWLDLNSAFLLKLSASGGLIYKTYFGGDGADYPLAATVDMNSHSLYVVGTTTSKTMTYDGVAYASPLRIKGYERVAPQKNAFLVQFDTLSGAPIQGVLWGPSNGTAGAYAVAVDSQNEVYVAGEVYGPNFPTSELLGRRSVQSQVASPNLNTADAFVTKFDPSFSLTGGYSTYLGGIAMDNAQAIAVDSTGAAYVGGNTCSRNFPYATPSVYGDPGPSNPNSFCNGFVTKVSADGSTVEFSTFIGGEFDGSDYPMDQVYALALNGSNGVYVAGYAVDDLIHTTANAFQRTTPNGNAHAFVGLIDASGQVQDLTLLGGPAFTIGLSIAVNHQSQVYVGGLTNSGIGFPGSTAGPSANTGFVTKLAPSLNQVLWTQFMGADVRSLSLQQPVPRFISAVAPTTTIFAVGERIMPNVLNAAIADGGIDTYALMLTDTPVQSNAPVSGVAVTPAAMTTR
jgi:hypothetical protein